MRIALIAFCVLALAGAAYLSFGREQPGGDVVEPSNVLQQSRLGAIAPKVEVIRVEAGVDYYSVTSHGVVSPFRELKLQSAVPGIVRQINENLVAGGFFKAGEVLAELDTIKLEHDVANAEAVLASAKRELETELARANIASREWEDVLGGAQEYKDLGTRRFVVAERAAQYKAAKAGLEEARQHLRDARIVAPFNAIVVSRNVERGSFVGTGDLVATLRGVDIAQIRVPVRLSDANSLGLGPFDQVRVQILSDGVHQRYGRLVRSVGFAQQETRSIHYVVKIDDPYNLSGTYGTVLPFGSFITARIQNIPAHKVFRVPDLAMRSSQIAVVDADGIVTLKTVKVLAEDGEDVLITSGLHNGDDIVLSPSLYLVDGMMVQKDEVQPHSGDQSPNRKAGDSNVTN